MREIQSVLKLPRKQSVCVASGLQRGKKQHCLGKTAFQRVAQTQQTDLWKQRGSSNSHQTQRLVFAKFSLKDISNLQMQAFIMDLAAHRNCSFVLAILAVIFRKESPYTYTKLSKFVIKREKLFNIQIWGVRLQILILKSNPKALFYHFQIKLPFSPSLLLIFNSTCSGYMSNIQFKANDNRTQKVRITSFFPNFQ